MQSSDSTNLAVTAGKLLVETTDSIISRHPFLEGMPSTQLEVLSANALRLAYHPGELICREGDPANRFYLIERGKVSIETGRSGAAPLQIQTLGSGDVLGWSWLFRPHYWQFDARVIEPTEAIFFYGSRLREECEADHDLGFELMKRMAAVLVERLQVTRNRWVSDRQ